MGKKKPKLIILMLLLMPVWGVCQVLDFDEGVTISTGITPNWHIPKPVITFYDDDLNQIGEFDYTDTGNVVFKGDIKAIKKLIYSGSFTQHFGAIIFWEWLKEQEEKQ